MATNNFCERLLQSINVEISLNTDGERDIVESTAWLQLIQKQQPLLGERYRKCVSLHPLCLCVSEKSFTTRSPETGKRWLLVTDVTC